MHTAKKKMRLRCFEIVCRIIMLSNPESSMKLTITPKSTTSENREWGWSASKYSLEQLESCSHNYELTKGSLEDTFIHVDRLSMGVGGYDSWTPNVKDEYLIPSGRTLSAVLNIAPSLI